MSNSAPSPALAGEVSKRSEDGGGAHAQAPAIHFSPPEHITVQILQDLSAPDCSFELIAQKAQTSVVALTLWMTRPDIAARIDALESAFSRRSRLTIAGYTRIPCSGALGPASSNKSHDTESHTLHREGDLKARALLTRNRENLVDAGKLLLRLHNAFPGPANSPPPPPWRGGGRLRARPEGGAHSSHAPRTPAENPDHAKRSPEARAPKPPPTSTPSRAPFPKPTAPQPDATHKRSRNRSQMPRGPQARPRP